MRAAMWNLVIKVGGAKLGWAELGWAGGWGGQGRAAVCDVAQ